MNPETEAFMLRNPGMYLVEIQGMPQAGGTVIVSQNGKFFAMRLDQELRPGHFHPDAYVRTYLQATGMGTAAGHEFG